MITREKEKFVDNLDVILSAMVQTKRIGKLTV